MTAAEALDRNVAQAIATATGLTEVTVSRRLSEAHGKTLVRNLFEDRWPPDA